MCGIVGYVGNENCQEIILGSLERLEYRGYDSSGIATIHNGQIQLRRTVGKLLELKAKILDEPVYGTIGIGHIRWATHGGVTERNAHPHLVKSGVAIVHNGIIENYAQLKKELDGPKRYPAQRRVYKILRPSLGLSQLPVRLDTLFRGWPDLRHYLVLRKA